MKVYELNNLIKNSHLVEERIKRYLVLGSIKMQEKDCSEIAGHLGKSENNLKFVLDNLKLGYFDWCITGCYYAVYHAALALILAKGYSSKNHDATLCILIKEHYNKEISEEDLNLINKFFISYQDLLFYLHSKGKREEASYSSDYKFDKKSVEEMRIKSIDFITKCRKILNQK